MKALRFIRCLTDEGACVCQPHTLVNLTCQVEDRPSEVKARAVPVLDPEHMRFINETRSVLWSRHPFAKKKRLVLSLIRALLSVKSYKALSQLSPEILVAWMKAEFPDEQLHAQDTATDSLNVPHHFTAR